MRAALAAAIVWLTGAYAAAQTGGTDAVRSPDRFDCDGAESGFVCRVDLATYIGWRVFHAQCASCHAENALGSSFAPDLTHRMRSMDERAFVAALDDGYLGPDDPMPPRGANPDVARYYTELWSYLSARASGDLPPGPLERLPNLDFTGPD